MDLWTRFIAAAWKAQQKVDTGKSNDRIWINEPGFAEPTIAFRVSESARAVRVAVTNATENLGLGLIMIPEFVDGSAPIHRSKGKAEFVPAMFGAGLFSLRLRDRLVGESDMPWFFLRQAEDLLSDWRVR